MQAYAYGVRPIGPHSHPSARVRGSPSWLGLLPKLTHPAGTCGRAECRRLGRGWPAPGGRGARVGAVRLFPLLATAPASAGVAASNGGLYTYGDAAFQGPPETWDSHPSSPWPVTHRPGLLEGVSRRSGLVGGHTGSGSAPLRMSLNPQRSTPRRRANTSTS